MSEEKIEFKIVEAKLVGSDTVVFRLEDGAMVKIRIILERAGVALNLPKPDGSPTYDFSIHPIVNVIPANKKYSKSKAQLTKTPPKEPTMKPI